MIRTRPGRTLVAVVFFALWGLITHGTFAGSGDEPHYLIIAHSLAFDRDLDVANNYEQASLITAGSLRPENHARMSDGRLRPVHDIGLPLLFAPAVAFAYVAADGLGDRLPPEWLRRARLNEGLLFRHQISLMMAVLTGLLGRELFLLFRSLSGADSHAFLWALLFTLSPPMLSHGFLFFTEIPTALLATFAFRHLGGYAGRRSGEVPLPVQPGTTALLLGLIGGMLLLIHARNVGLVVGLSAVAWLGLRRGVLARAIGVAFLGGVVAGVVARSAVTYALWGTVVATPHAALDAAIPVTTTAYEMFVRLSGLLFDREHGLLAYAPLYALSVAGLFVAARRRAPLSANLLIVIGAYLLPVLLPQLNVHGWRGGWSPAARFLVPIAPLLCIAAYIYVLAGPRRLLLPLAALQAGINVYLWQFPKTLWNDGDGSAAFPYARWLPTWTGPSLADHLLFGGALCALLALGYAAARTALRSPDGIIEQPVSGQESGTSSPGGVVPRGRSKG